MKADQNKLKIKLQRAIKATLKANNIKQVELAGRLACSKQNVTFQLTEEYVERISIHLLENTLEVAKQIAERKRIEHQKTISRINRKIKL